MLALAFIGSYLNFAGRIGRYRLFLWATFLSFPLPFIATWTGWFTAEIGRQPWAVYGLLRTADAMTPFLTAQTAAISLAIFGIIYTFIFSFGIFYIYRLLQVGLVPPMLKPAIAAVPNRPLSLADEDVSTLAAEGASTFADESARTLAEAGE
jgi:cytochrome d ubiquinol oxidase subunit I